MSPLQGFPSPPPLTVALVGLPPPNIIMLYLKIFYHKMLNDKMATNIERKGMGEKEHEKEDIYEQT